MASAIASSSSTPADPGESLHPSLLGIAAALEQSENQRKQRLGLAQEFLGMIDAWAKTKAGTEAASLLAPFIESVSPIVTAFAIGNARNSESLCKTPYPTTNAITTAVPRVTKMAEKPNHALPAKPKENNSPWVTIARKAAKLPDPPAARMNRNNVSLAKPAISSPPKEDKRIFLRLGPQHEWRKLSPVILKKIVTEWAGVAVSAITAMYSVRSGFVIECVSDALRDSMLSVGTSFHAKEAKIEPAS